jgi:F-type H+-transporting ATPase subunit b
MPQLEFVTYMSQLFWLFIFFTLYYAITTKYTLPTVSANLKTRKKFLEAYSSDISSSDIEEKEALTAYDNLFTESFASTKKALDNRNKQISLYSEESFKKANNELFANANQTFISSVGNLEAYKKVTS